MSQGVFFVFVSVFGLMDMVHMYTDTGNNSENSSSEPSSNTTVLNNLLAREILLRQALENKVATLERQIQALVGDVAKSKSTCTALQRDVQGISLRQNNMSSSLQTITQRVDSENVNIKESIRHLSSVTTSLQSNAGRASGTPVAFLARISAASSPEQTEHTLKFDSSEFNLGQGYDSTSGIFQAPVAGVYSFQTTIFVQSGHYEGYIAKNGVPEVYLSIRGRPYQDSNSLSLTLSLSPGDRVWVFQTTNPALTPGRSLFAGYLISAV